MKKEVLHYILDHVNVEELLYNLPQDGELATAAREVINDYVTRNKLTAEILGRLGFSRHKGKECVVWRMGEFRVYQMYDTFYFATLTDSQGNIQYGMTIQDVNHLHRLYLAVMSEKIPVPLDLHE